MASKRNALSSLIPGLDLDLYIGFHFLPTYEEGIRIVNIKNKGGKLLSIFEVDDDLFRRPPEQLEECYCFTKLKRVGKTKVNRKLQDGSDRRFWKNVNRPEEVVVNNNVIGWVTKLVLRWDKNTPTEWHILEYRDRKTPDPNRWVLCRIYKREKNNGSDSPRGDTNQVQHYEMGQSAYTQPDWVSQVSSMNQVQFPGVDQHAYPPGPPSGDMVNNPQQFPSCTYSNGGIDTVSGVVPYIDNTMIHNHFASDIGAGQFYPSTLQDSSMWDGSAEGDINQVLQHYDEIGTYSNGGIDTVSGFHHADLNTSDIDMDKWNEIINQLSSELYN